MNLTLYGAASDQIDHAYIERVEELGREMAKNGHTLVFGAGSTGLMGAAARGMTEENGHIIGVIPRFMRTFEPIYKSCTELILTETMAQRKDEMENRADAFIITPGGIGTFDEFFQILTLKMLGQHQKAIILYNINGFWDNMLSVIGTDIFKGFITKNVFDGFTICETPQGVFDSLALTEKKNKKQETPETL